MDVPLRMFTSEVLELARWGQQKLIERRKEEKFPDPIDRGKEDIYDGYEVYRALGLIKNDPREETDPWMDALNGNSNNRAA